MQSVEDRMWCFQTSHGSEELYRYWHVFNRNINGVFEIVLLCDSDIIQQYRYRKIL